MLTLLRRWLTDAPRRAPRTARPRLEALEGREVPATLFNDNAFVVGLNAAAGFEAQAQILDGFTNITRFPGFLPFVGYQGPLSVGAGDVNNDGTGDAVVAAVISQGHFKAFDGVSGQLLFSIAAFPGFGGTVSAASGDVNGDGSSDMLVAANGANGHVKAYSGRDGSLLASFFAFLPFLGPVSVAAADFNRDGTDEILVGAGGPGINGRIGLFNRDGTVFNNGFFSFTGFDGPISVAAGDVNFDNFPDVIVGALGGGGGNVRAFSGIGNVFTLLDNFLAYEITYTGGVNVGVSDFNRDGNLEIRTIPAAGGRPTEVRTFDGVSGAQLTSFVPGPAINAGGSIAGLP